MMAFTRQSRRLTALSLVVLLVFSTLCYRTIYDEASVASGAGNRWTSFFMRSGAPDHADGGGRPDSLASPVEPASQASALVERLDFAGFDNETGRTFGGRPIVPNVIHYIRFNKTTFSFVDYVCLRSAYIHQRPERIYLHTNLVTTSTSPSSGAGSSASVPFAGRYWERIRAEPDLYARIVIEPIELPLEIFGQQLSDGWRLYHGSDVARIRTMMKHGGIYLDNDVYVVQNLDKYRKYEIAMGWDEGQFLGSQVIVAHRDARFLPMWLDTYRQYHAELWYYNAGERPTTEILHRWPHLIHRVRLRFGVHMLMHELYDSADWSDWRRTQDTIHLLINHRSYLDPHFAQYPEFDEDNIRQYPYTFGELARLALALRPQDVHVPGAAGAA